MSPQRTLAETGRAWISSRVRWCLRFPTLWYQKTISDENKQMKDLTPETSAMMPLPWKKSANYAFAIYSLQTTPGPLDTG